MTETLRVSGGAGGLRTLVQRAEQLDAQALVRFQAVAAGRIDAFVTTPFQVFAARRIIGQVSRDKSVFSAQTVLTALETGELGQSMDAAWPGALPPKDNWVELDVIPVDIVHRLADQGRDLTRQFSGPLGPPKSLLDQNVLAVSGHGHTAEVTMRAIFTCTALGLIPSIGARADVPRHLRVAKAGRWVRIDAPFGSVYESDGLNLFA
ncbi:hypothetical protein WG915_08400 [Corynebacterium sp. H128]|uniref:hypothetical protein n=1 Tax=unclassified Corynebacterium TaxID=2624378 RepID=UPI00309F2F3D